VFFLVFGSSASGKTVATRLLDRRIAGIAVHDFDEIGVPSGADTAWRHRANETWVRRALEYQGAGVDVLLAGQTPLGELLATPSAPLLEAISACLLDCDDQARLARLAPRGGEGYGDYLRWAEWMREHVADPGRRPEVIRHPDTDEEMRWIRWERWTAEDPRWRVLRLDTTELSPGEVADEFAAWIEAERALMRGGTHPLSNWADVADQR
jgi:hypothetical protein